MFGKNRKLAEKDYSDDYDIATGKCEKEGYESDELDDGYKADSESESDADVEDVKTRAPSPSPRIGNR